jgi:hypothetical protein
MCSKKVLVYNKAGLIHHQGKSLPQPGAVTADTGLGHTSYEAVPRVKAGLRFGETILITPTKQHGARVEATPAVTALVVRHYVDVSIVVTAGSF